MYQAESKEVLLEGMGQLPSKGEWKNYCEDLICIAKGMMGNSWEGSEETLTGKPIEVSLSWSVAPDHEEDFSKVIVTTIDITERKQAEEKIRQQLRRLTILRNIDQAITGSMDLRFVLTTVLRHVKAELGMDAAVILLFSPVEHLLKYELGIGMQTDALKFTSLRLGDGYAGKAALARKTVFISGLQTRETDFLRSPTFSQEGFVCYFGVPLVAKDEIKGVMELFHRSTLEPEQEWLDFMETLAGQVAIAIDNATLYEGLQRATIELATAYDATIEGWSKALDLRDKETEGHTQRVTETSLKLARAMGVEEEEILHMQRGALLHDIGKMGVPDSILLKPDKLTEEEWEIMRKHPVFAYEMLSPIAYLRPALDIPYCHHEKWDGTGYPRGLKGEEIPKAARIFAIIDVFDALTADRPYRKAWSEAQALAHIQEQSGKHFDPQVVVAFLSLLDKDVKTKPNGVEGDN
jgi:putative nucleotidyltransferase with HDIG domain